METRAGDKPESRAAPRRQGMSLELTCSYWEAFVALSVAVAAFKRQIWAVHVLLVLYICLFPSTGSIQRPDLRGSKLFAVYALRFCIWVWSQVKILQEMSPIGLQWRALSRSTRLEGNVSAYNVQGWQSLFESTDGGGFSQERENTREVKKA